MLKVVRLSTHMMHSRCFSASWRLSGFLISNQGMEIIHTPSYLNTERVCAYLISN